MKSPNRTRLDALLHRERDQRAVQMSQLSHELFVLADVLAGPMAPSYGSERAPALERRAAQRRKRQNIHVGLLIENGLIDADGKPPGWTVEQDRAEELLALSELSALRRVS